MMETEITDEFASTMQQLSAQAEKTRPEDAGAQDTTSEASWVKIVREFTTVHSRLQRLDEMIARRLGRLEAAEQTTVGERLRKIEETFFALPNTESVNEQIFP